MFANATDFIANFTGAVFSVGANGIVNDTDDVAVIGRSSSPCPLVPNCQLPRPTGNLTCEVPAVPQVRPGLFFCEQQSAVAGGGQGRGRNATREAQR